MSIFYRPVRTFLKFQINCRICFKFNKQKVINYIIMGVIMLRQNVASFTPEFVLQTFNINIMIRTTNFSSFDQGEPLSCQKWIDSG